LRQVFKGAWGCGKHLNYNRNVGLEPGFLQNLHRRHTIGKKGHKTVSLCAALLPEVGVTFEAQKLKIDPPLDNALIDAFVRIYDDICT
jgi:hypothetical protein